MMQSLPAIEPGVVLARRDALLQAAKSTRVPQLPVVETVGLAFELLQAGSPELAERLLDELDTLPATTLADTVESQIAILRARALYDLSRWDELFVHLERVRSLGRARHAATEGLLLMRGAWAALRVKNTGRADEYFEAAARLSSAAMSFELAGDVRFFRACRLANEGHGIFHATREMQSTIALFRELHEPLYLIHALVTTAGFELRLGNPGHAYALACEALEAAATSGNVAEAVGALSLIAVICYRQGRPRQSLESVARARTLLESAGRTWRAPQLDLVECRASLMMGDLDRSRESLARARQQLMITPDGQLEALAHEYAGLIELESGLPASALSSLDACVTVLQSVRDASYFTAEALGWWALAACELGRFSEAKLAAERGFNLLERSGELIDRGHLLHSRAVVANRLGDQALALQLLDTSEFQARAFGDSYELGRVLLTRCELVSEDLASGMAAAAEALRISTQCEASGLQSRAGDILARMRFRRPVEVGFEEVDSPRSSSPGIISESPPMRALLAEVRKIGRSRGAVLVLGETGVGKEVIARAIHDTGRPRRRDFVPVNCAAIPETLFEREFFGHAKGAYTGADQDRPGLVELADGGTLFLDEVGELPAAMQAKLLRLLQDGTYRRVGDAGERSVSLRVVAATNRDLSLLVADRRFREDLYYRLRIFEVEVPPLRERPEDVVPLAKLFLERESASLSTELWLEKAAWVALKHFAWPGNVRELEAAVVSAAARADRSGCIRLEHLPRNVRQGAPAQAAAAMDLVRHLELEERRMIQLALDRAKQSKTEAARYLGISRNTLYDKMKRLGIEG